MNKREERLLNVELKFFDRDKRFRLHILQNEKVRFEKKIISIEKELKRLETMKKSSDWSRPWTSDGLMITRWQIDWLKEKR